MVCKRSMSNALQHEKLQLKLLYEHMVGILMMHCQQITLDTVTPETEY